MKQKYQPFLTPIGSLANKLSSYTCIIVMLSLSSAFRANNTNTNETKSESASPPPPEDAKSETVSAEQIAKMEKTFKEEKEAMQKKLDEINVSNGCLIFSFYFYFLGL